MKESFSYTKIPEDSRIGITCNSLQGERREEDAEYDEPETIRAIERAIERKGLETIRIEADLDCFQRLREERPDFVFNIAEGVGRGARESQVPFMLEMLGIPYMGSDPLTLAIALDKARTKEILSYYGIPTPRFQVLWNVDDGIDSALDYPLFVKPLLEGSSIGITEKSLVNDGRQLREVSKELIERLKEPVIVEEFLEGREFTVAMLGNEPRVLPIIELDFSSLPEEKRFDCFEVKWYLDDDKLVCPARIDEGLKRRIERTAIKTFRALRCRDLCRIDMRLDADGIPNVIEANPLPGLAPDPKENSRFPKACYTAGMSYDEIIWAVLDAAVRRYEGSSHIQSP
jgi:D-alanine-D-alanine ligase